MLPRHFAARRPSQGTPLEILPPALWLAHGFLIGEPTTHIEGRPAFTPYIQLGGKYYEGSEPMTAGSFVRLMCELWTDIMSPVSRLILCGARSGDHSLVSVDRDEPPLARRPTG
jgi:hypothetical protein